MIIQRRAFLGGLLSAFAAPAIVRAASLMPVRAIAAPPPDLLEIIDGNSLLSMERLREFLLPGLFDITGRYRALPVQWDNVFTVTA